MKIREKELVIHNLLSITTESKEKIAESAVELRQYVVMCNLFPTGPIVYSVNNGKYEVGVPINEVVDTLDTGLRFQGLVELPKCLYVRMMEADEDIEVIYRELRKYANERKFIISDETYYNVILDVYGEAIIDIYLPFESEDEK